MRRLAFTGVERLFASVVRRVKVEGTSMLPTYVAGEVLTAIRRWRRVRVGDVVVVRDPRDASRWLLKRCVARQGSMLDVRGDNEYASTDSREFGLVASTDVRYLVLRRQK
jgi:nickel-type superoxide dismutase maturation protease